MENLDTAWIRKEELSVSPFTVAPEHAWGFGFSEEDCAKPVMVLGESDIVTK